MYVRYTPEQVDALERLYHECPKSSSIRRQQLIRECPILSHIDPEQIKVWFQNRRCREKQRILCQERNRLVMHFQTPKDLVWTGAVIRLQEKIREEWKKKEKGTAGLLEELQRMEKVARSLVEFADGFVFPLEGRGAGGGDMPENGGGGGAPAAAGKGSVS